MNGIKAVPIVNDKLLYAGAALACVALLGATVHGCVHPKTGADTSVLCSVFEPLTFAKSDTQETKKLITVYNKTWEFYCD